MVNFSLYLTYLLDLLTQDTSNLSTQESYTMHVVEVSLCSDDTYLTKNMQKTSQHHFLVSSLLSTGWNLMTNCPPLHLSVNLCNLAHCPHASLHLSDFYTPSHDTCQPRPQSLIGGIHTLLHGLVYRNLFLLFIFLNSSKIQPSCSLLGSIPVYVPPLNLISYISYYLSKVTTPHTCI